MSDSQSNREAFNRWMSEASSSGDPIKSLPEQAFRVGEYARQKSASKNIRKAR